MKRYYGGVGSRETPTGIIKEFERISYELSQLGLIPSTGCADGADASFRRGCADARVYKCRDGFDGGIDPTRYDNYHKTYDIVKSVLGNSYFENASKFAELAHRRNCYQILGDDLNSPVEFVLLWAKPDSSNKSVLGGTRMAYKLAKLHNIECFNFYFKDDIEKFNQYIDTCKLLGLI